MENFRTTKKIVKINDVIPNKWNPNVQSKAVFEKEIESIKMHGLLGSILVREVAGCYEILDGEHRWKACKEIGYKEIPVESVGEMKDDDVKLLTVLLNNLRGKDDIEKRVKIYNELDAGQLSLLPFTAEEIEHEKQFFAFDFSKYDKQEEIDKRKPNYTLLLNLTIEEKGLWDYAVTVAKEEKHSPVTLLISMIENYLQVRGLALQSKESLGNF